MIDANFIKKTRVLCILDGFGLGDKNFQHNAVSAAHTPNLDRIISQYPTANIETSGCAIGLPHGQVGSSEVGHMTIGCGRIIMHSLPRITKALDSGEITNLHHIKNIAKIAKNVHIIGLISDGGVHSISKHVTDLALILSQNNASIKIHAISDGRDTSQCDAVYFLTQFQKICKNIPNVELATICGRYYAMDRDNRHDRTEVAYNLYTNAVGNKIDDVRLAITNLYNRGVYDEFFEPMVCSAFSGIKNGDAIIFANFRPDRMKQIVKSFAAIDDFEDFQRQIILRQITLLTMTEYFEQDVINHFTIKPTAIFERTKICDTFSETVSKQGYNQLHIAETEKYAHVTFFFNGGCTKRQPNEDWIIVPSPQVKSYDTCPEMSAMEICSKVRDNIGKYDFIIVNLANCDMVGHTGNFAATIKAVETIDIVISKMMHDVLKVDGTMIITADHGNAEIMLDEFDNPHTRHTQLAVPIIVIDNKVNSGMTIKNGTLADIAPTLLHIANIPIPTSMTGNVLLTMS